MDFNDFLEMMKNLIVIGYTAWKWLKDYNKKTVWASGTTQTETEKVTKTLCN